MEKGFEGVLPTLANSVVIGDKRRKSCFWSPLSGAVQYFSKVSEDQLKSADCVNRDLRSTNFPQPELGLENKSASMLLRFSESSIDPSFKSLFWKPQRILLALKLVLNSDPLIGFNLP